MKKHNYLLLLVTLIASSCQTSNNQNSQSEKTNESPITSQNEILSENSSIQNSTEDEISSETDLVSESFEDSIVDESIEESSDVSIEDSSEDSEEEIKEPLTREVKDVSDFLGSDNDVYRINITTENGEFPTDKETYVNGTLNVTEQDTSKVMLEDAKMGIRLRGNSTMDADKKPFRIKFDKKQSLFGLTKAKSWVLLANYYDKTNIRNYLAYMMGRKMTNLYFQPDCIFVDVYFNGDYYGLFTLAQQMEAKEGRVDITNNVSEDGIDSFFFEADVRARDEYRGYEGKAYFDIGSQNNPKYYAMALKYPDCDDYIEALANKNSEDEAVKQEALDYITQYEKDINWFKPFVQNAFNAIHDRSNYQDYIDVDSFIDYYLIQEFFKNVDVGSTSQYYFIDQSEENPLIHAGPVWDFDISSGVTSKEGVYSYYLSNDLYVSKNDKITNYLLQDENFKNKVKNRYTELRDEVFMGVFDDIYKVRKTISIAQKRNLQRWPINMYNVRTWIEQNCYGYDYQIRGSLDEHYVYLESYLRKRIDVLDKEYLW